MAHAEHERTHTQLPVFEGESAEGPRRAVEQALAVPCVVTRRRRVFEIAVGRCRCGIIVLAIVAESALRWLDSLAHKYPHSPIITVVPLSADAARLLAETPTKRRRIVWLDEVTTRLPEVLDELLEHDPVQTLFAELIGSPAGHPFVARTLAVIASAQRPFTVLLSQV